MYDFHRMMEVSGGGGATKLKCPGVGAGAGAEFADAIIKHMGPGSGGSQAEHKPVPQMQRA
jgi:hypothetical protein